MTSPDRTLRLACSDSELGRAHADAVLTALADRGVRAERVPVADLQEAVRTGTAELALCPWVEATGALSVLAVLPRTDARDVLVARDGLTLGELPAGSVLAVDSELRRGQLAALGLDWQIELVADALGARTQVGQAYDAVVLALAELGAAREDATEVLDPIQVLPQPTQGCWVILGPSDDDGLDAVAALDHAPSRALGLAEQHFAVALGATVTAGALAEWVEGDEGDEIWLRGVALTPDGELARLAASGPLADPAGVGAKLAQRMVDEGLVDLEAREKVDA